MKINILKDSKHAHIGPISQLKSKKLSDAAMGSALQRRIEQSALMQRQRDQIDKTFGTTVQRVAKNEQELLQGKFDSAQRQTLEEEEEPLQGKFNTPLQKQGPEEEELMQGKFSEELQRNQQATAVNHTGMPNNLKSGIESLSGIDISDVRVHHNSSKPAQLNALAYAQGNDIHLAAGQEQQLPHEAWHTVQQRQGRVKPTMQIEGQPINDDARLEHEADVMGERALQYKK